MIRYDRPHQDEPRATRSRTLPGSVCVLDGLRPAAAGSFYYEALRANDADDNTLPFQVLIAKAVKHWCIEYLKMLSPNGLHDEQAKGYTFFKRIAAFLPPKP